MEVNIACIEQDNLEEEIKIPNSHITFSIENHTTTNPI